MILKQLACCAADADAFDIAEAEAGSDDTVTDEEAAAMLILTPVCPRYLHSRWDPIVPANFDFSIVFAYDSCLNARQAP